MKVAVGDPGKPMVCVRSDAGVDPTRGPGAMTPDRHSYYAD